MNRWNRLRSLVSTPRGRMARRRATWQASAWSGLEPLEPRTLLTTVGVYDENVIATNSVDFTATGSSMTVDQFKQDVAAAFARNNGGVIDGSILSGSYDFGVDRSKSLRFPTVGSGTWSIGTPGGNRPISGTGAFSTLGLAGPESNRSVTFSFSTIANGDPGEQVVQFGVTALSLTGRDYGTVTTTGYLAGGGSLSASRVINEPNGQGDTFFGLAAPAGDYFTGFTLGYSGPAVADVRLWFDDIGFITAAPSAVNQPPVAVADSYDVDEDTLLTIAAPGVLGNDTDADGDTLTAVLVDRPANGIVNLQADGSFLYLPNFNFFGTDSFTYKANDGTADGNVATVTITVNPVNDAPFVDSPTVTTDEDVPVSDQIDSIDVEGDPYTFVLLADAAHGTAIVNPDGTFTYTPGQDYHGTDSFTFRATDDKGAGRDGTVTVIVRSVNDAPVARDNTYSVDQGQTLTLAPASPITRLVMNSTPGDFVGDGLSYEYNTDTATFRARENFDNGVSLSVIQPGASGSDSWFLDFAAPSDAPLQPGLYEDARRFPFQPAGQPGLDVYGNGRGHSQLVGEFVVYDVEYGTGDSVTRFAASFVQQGLRSNGTLEPPMIGTIQYNSTIGAGAGVLANDTDVDGDLLRAILVSGPVNGTLSLNPDGTFTYTPDADFHGTDTFTYVANDGRLDSNVATVTITVNRVNKAPVAADAAVATDEDTPLVIDVPANVHDPDGDPLAVVVLTGPAGGTLEANQDGTFTYTPFDNFHGTDSFTYRANDGTADSNVATVTITVNAINDSPTVSAPGPVTVGEGESAVIGGISVADVDVKEGTGEVRVTLSVAEGTLTVATDVVGGLAAGQVIDNGTGTVVLEGPIEAVNATLAAGATYLGRVDFQGSDTLTVTVDDLGNTGAGGSLTATGTVEIRVLAQTDVSIGDVIAAVERLRGDGALNKGQANALVVKLENADRAMGRGQDRVFLNMLGAFDNQVTAFIAQGVLTPEQGQDLLDAVERLRKGGLRKTR